jgi:hypothetical protein
MNTATNPAPVSAPFQIFAKEGRSSALVSGKVYEDRKAARAAIRALRAAGDTRDLFTFPCLPGTVST